MTRSSALRCVCVGLLAAAGLFLPPERPATASAFEIAPTTLFLPHGARAATLYITNRDAAPITVQVEGFAWQSAEQLGAAEAVAVSPPIVTIAPNQRQTIRMTVGEDNSAAERAFRLHVSEIPDAAMATSTGVRVLLNFDVPVFVAAAQRAKPILIWQAQKTPSGLRLTAHADGASHVKLSNLALALPDGRRINPARQAFAYILAGQTREWDVPTGESALPPSVHVTGQDEYGGGVIDVLVPVTG